MSRSLLFLFIPGVFLILTYFFSDYIILNVIKYNNIELTNVNNKDIIDKTKSIYLLNNLESYEKIKTNHVELVDSVSKQLSFLYFSKNKTVVESEKIVSSDQIGLPKLTEQDKIVANSELIKKTEQVAVQMVVPETETAILNDHIFNIGDEFNGIKLISIKRNNLCYIQNKGPLKCIKF